MKDKISIIVPVYNVEKYIEKCLNSLISQTYENIEIVAVNDGSTDGSRNVLEKYHEQYSAKIRIIDKKNGGLSDARNVGIENAKGKYVLFIDSDDFIDENTVEDLWKLTDNGNKKMVFYGCVKEYEGNHESQIILEDKYANIYQMLAYGYVSACTKLYNREWLISSGVKFPKGLIYEDVEFYSKLVTHISSIEEISFCNKPFLHYIQREGSISHYETVRVKEIQTINNRILRYYEEKNVNTDFRSAQEYMMVKALLGSYLIKYKYIADKVQRKKLIKENWNYINKLYPNWKKNIYIRNAKKKFKIYFWGMNLLTYNIISKVPNRILDKLREK